MYLMKAPAHYAKDMRVFGHELIDGVCIVGKQYYWKLMKYEGFEDVTPDNWKRAFRKPANMEKCLHIHYSGHGDMLFLTPVFSALKKRYPGLQLDVSTSAAAVQLLYGNPNVDNFIINKSTEMPHYVDLYDDVVNYDCMIAGNTASNVKNCYDIVEEWSGVKLEKKVPEIYLTEGEKQRAREYLAFCGFPAKENVVIQYESSSPVRSMNPKTLVKLAEYLTYEGYAVFLYGQKNYDKWNFVRCPECGELNMFEIPGRVREFTYSCVGCDRNIEIDSNDPGLDDINFVEGKSIREIAAIISQADYFIGPDSSGIHIAAAFDIPSLAIFSSFDASLRCKTYGKTAWIQEPHRCAPCFLHSSACPNNPGSSPIPPCMNKITAEKIFTRFKELTEGVYNRDHFSVGFPAQMELCPVCDSYGNYAVRKGNIIYNKCIRCGSLYACGDAPKEHGFSKVYDYKKAAIAKTLNERWAGKLKGKNALVIGGSFEVIDGLEKYGWKTFSWDGKLDLMLPNGEVFSIADIEQEPYDLVVVYESLEKSPEFTPFLRYIHKNMSDDGVLVIITPDAEQWAGNNSNWIHLNTHSAGENRVLLTKMALVGPVLSCHKLEAFAEESMPPTDCMWVYCRKEGSSIE